MLYLADFALQKQPEHSSMVAISWAWYNGSYTMAAKPIKSLEMHKTMIQFLIKKIDHSDPGGSRPPVSSVVDLPVAMLTPCTHHQSKIHREFKVSNFQYQGSSRSEIVLIFLGGDVGVS